MPTVEPAAGTLVLEGKQSDVAVEPTLQPGGGFLALQGAPPNIILAPPGTIVPATGRLTLSGATPTVITVIRPTPALLVLTGKPANAYRSRTDPSASLLTQCEQIWDATKQHQLAEDRLRREPPLTRIWDSEWHLQHLLAVDYKSEFSWISNDSGPGRSEIPYDTPVAQWIADESGRIARGEGRNVHITVDYCGARWDGRMDKFAIEQRDDGDIVLVVDWLHSYENLKWYQCWSNPFLPSFIQWPRAFLLPGPVTWILKMMLWFQLFREHFPLVTIPDDPLSLSAWFTNPLDQSNWAVVVKPQGFLEAMASGVVWGLASSRFETWHDMAHVMLEDAELLVDCRRYLPGDPLPWPGAVLRYGTLVVDIVDKSGVYIGTSHGGTIWDGLVRTVVEFADDFIDSTVNVIEDTSVPQDYFRIGHKYTDKALPYVIFMEGDNSPIQTSALINSPAKAVQVIVGGHSAPGVNEAISATVQVAGDLAGLGIVPIGQVLDTFVKPFYEDTILAWWSAKSSQRAQHNGWSRYFEYFQQGANKAYSIAALMVLRAGFWATKTVVSWQVSVVDGLPFMIGDNGLGHFFLEDRVGLILKGDPTGTIHMDRCRKIDLAWDEENPPEWSITIGDDRVFQDPAQRAWGRIEQMISALRDLGVY